MRRWLELTVCAIFGLSALTKLLAFEDSLRFFAELTHLSDELTRYGLAILIFIELLIAFALPIRWRGQVAVQNSTLVILVLFLGLSFGIAVSGMTSCGCFGTFWVFSPWISVVKNICMILIMVFLRVDLRKCRYA